MLQKVWNLVADRDGAKLLASGKKFKRINKEYTQQENLQNKKMMKYDYFVRNGQCEDWKKNNSK
jgi:hypothetical protein